MVDPVVVFVVAAELLTEDVPVEVTELEAVFEMVLVILEVCVLLGLVTVHDGKSSIDIASNTSLSRAIVLALQLPPFSASRPKAQLNVAVLVDASSSKRWYAENASSSPSRRSSHAAESTADSTDMSLPGNWLHENSYELFLHGSLPSISS